VLLLVGSLLLNVYMALALANLFTIEIKNPINLARSILEMSNKPLSLRRVPPNLLVGQGATDFAWEHGIPVVPHEMIVSRNARDRFVRWKEDLRRAEGRLTPAGNSCTHNDQGDEGGEEELIDLEYEERVRSKQRRDHTTALMNGTWNEGQPDSPSPPARSGPTSPAGDRGYFNKSSFSRTASRSPAGSPSKRLRYANQAEDGPSRLSSPLRPHISEVQQTTPESTSHQSASLQEQARSGSSDGPASTNESPDSSVLLSQQIPPMAFSQEGTAESPSKPFKSDPKHSGGDDDIITDTVGAIAIDMYGHIAAGSSSGGIGMKHRGRVGPAALVGIGTAVVPEDERDDGGVSVAAVTSGTGEHMATSMASQKCAERLYHNTRRARGGADIEATEEEAMESFVQADFMGHPGVTGSHSAGAIGVMAVKKTSYGFFLHFAHNTDSFALASMHSNEKEAKCVMSRIGDHGNVVQGGRKIRLD
jgi:taspase (threonine aspartase 1)